MAKSNRSIHQENLQLLDYIYVTIRQEKKITITKLFIIGEEKYKKSEICYDQLLEILKEMTRGKWILKDGIGNYFVNPLKLDFISFSFERKKQLFKLKSERYFENAIKILPIFLSFLFGVVTAFQAFVDIKSKWNVVKSANDKNIIDKKRTDTLSQLSGH